MELGIGFSAVVGASLGVTLLLALFYLYVGSLAALGLPAIIYAVVVDQRERDKQGNEGAESLLEDLFPLAVAVQTRQHY